MLTATGYLLSYSALHHGVIRSSVGGDLLPFRGAPTEGAGRIRNVLENRAESVI